MSAEEGAVVARHVHYLHCVKCLHQNPKNPRAWDRLSVSVDADGQLLLWCNRHQVLVGGWGLKDPPRVRCAQCPPENVHNEKLGVSN